MAGHVGKHRPDHDHESPRGGSHGHTHDHIDWAERIPNLRQADALHAQTYAAIARRLTSGLPAGATEVDAGAGAGGMSAAFAAALYPGGGRLVLVDAVPELLSVAAETATSAVTTAAEAGHASAGDSSHDAAQRAHGSACAAEAGPGATVVGPAEEAGPGGEVVGSAEEAGPGGEVVGPAEEAGPGAKIGGLAEGSIGRVSAAGSANAALPGADVVGSVEGVRSSGEGVGSGERSGYRADPAGLGESATPGVGSTARGHSERHRSGPVGIGGGSVEIDTVQADVAEGDLPSRLPPAQLVWASHTMHHLPDQQAGLAELARVLAPGGVLAIAEGGLETECLPWDLGIGAPGFERRLLAARDAWFAQMRESIAGSVPMPYGWTEALRQAGLVDVGSFSRIVDHPAPTSDAVRDFVVARIAFMVESLGEQLSAEDQETAGQLLDPASEYYLGRRDDLFMLGVRTVHYGRMP